MERLMLTLLFLVENRIATYLLATMAMLDRLMVAKADSQEKERRSGCQSLGCKVS
jgi:hypothetical protein